MKKSESKTNKDIDNDLPCLLKRSISAVFVFIKDAI